MKLNMATDGATGVANYALFHCPGCDDAHMVTVGGSGSVWGWNGSKETPTFTPSILVKSGHYAGSSPSCWCTYAVEYPDNPSPFRCYLCHSFVTEGRIRFLDDCTHKLAGQTVDIPEWDD